MRQGVKRRNQDPLEYSFHHFAERLAERYGTKDLTRRTYDQLCARPHPSQVLADEQHQLVFRREVLGTPVVMVWCKLRQLVTTALPPEQFE